MFVLGLTGSIGMGKSETAKMFQRLGVPVYDADAAVHRLYAPGGAAVTAVGTLFPGSVKEGAVDRQALGAIVLGDDTKLRSLEAIVHPLVAAARQAWLEEQAEKGEPLVVLDIPLLYEGGGEKYVDAVLVVSAPPELQRARVLARPGMTEERFAAILAKQVSDADKRARADFVIATDLGLEHAFHEVDALVRVLKARQGTVWKGKKS